MWKFWKKTVDESKAREAEDKPASDEVLDHTHFEKFKDPVDAARESIFEYWAKHYHISWDALVHTQVRLIEEAKRTIELHRAMIEDLHAKQSSLAGTILKKFDPPYANVPAKEPDTKTAIAIPDPTIKVTMDSTPHTVAEEAAKKVLDSIKKTE